MGILLDLLFCSNSSDLTFCRLIKLILFEFYGVKSSFTLILILSVPLQMFAKFVFCRCTNKLPSNKLHI